MSEALVLQLWNMCPVSTRIPYEEYKEYVAKQLNIDNKYDDMQKDKAKNGHYTREVLGITEYKQAQRIKATQPKKQRRRRFTQNAIEKTKNQKFYRFMRGLSLERDLHECTECGTTNNLHVHHIMERRHGGTDDIDNLITLCAKCHAEKHKGQNVYKIMTKQ